METPPTPYQLYCFNPLFILNIFSFSAFFLSIVFNHHCSPCSQIILQPCFLNPKIYNLSECVLQCLLLFAPFLLTAPVLLVFTPILLKWITLRHILHWAALIYYQAWFSSNSKFSLLLFFSEILAFLVYHHLYFKFSSYHSGYFFKSLLFLLSQYCSKTVIAFPFL